MDFSKELVAASTIPILLSILRSEESYGYSIIKRVHDLTSGEMEWSEGMVYAVLHRMEKNKLVEAFWKESENGKKRKYYRLLKAGHLELARQEEQWNLVQSTLLKTREAVNAYR